MRLRLHAVIQKLYAVFTLPKPVDNFKEQDTSEVKSRQMSHQRSTIPCHNCDGAGIVESLNSKWREFGFSKFGETDGLYSARYNACPICKGKGYVETIEIDRSFSQIFDLRRVCNMS